MITGTQQISVQLVSRFWWCHWLPKCNSISESGKSRSGFHRLADRTWGHPNGLPCNYIKTIKNLVILRSFFMLIIWLWLLWCSRRGLPKQNMGNGGAPELDSLTVHLLVTKGLMKLSKIFLNDGHPNSVEICGAFCKLCTNRWVCSWAKKWWSQATWHHCEPCRCWYVCCNRITVEVQMWLFCSRPPLSLGQCQRVLHYKMFVFVCVS